MNTILSLLMTVVMGFFAFATFVLAEQKEEIFEKIKFKE